MPDEVQKLSFTRNMHAYVKTQVQNGHQVQPKRLPCHVSAIKENDLIELTFDVIGPYTLPKIVVPQSFSKYHREPTQVGDPGFVLMGDFQLAGPSANPGGTASLHLRGNLTNGVFQPISNKTWPKKDPNMFLVTGGPSGHTTQSADGKTSTVIDALNNILHNSASTIAHNALNNMLHTVVNGVMSHTSPTIQHIAQTAFAIANKSGAIQLLAPTLNMAALGNLAELEAYDADVRNGDKDISLTPPPLPVPGGQINVTITGNLHATGSISTPSGSVGGSGSAGPPGATGPQGPPGAPIQGTLPQNITGAKGGNAALASLLTALVHMGLIVDNTTA
jgi:hypothetical protein